VPKQYIYGKALRRYWPLSAASVIHHEDLAPSPQGRRPGEDTPGSLE
jgi:hypothetical protein